VGITGVEGIAVAGFIILFGALGISGALQFWFKDEVKGGK
jgi:hypothetical protein